MVPLLFALMAFLGGIVAALMGWAQASTPWNWRKFLTSFLRSLVGGVVLAYGADYTGGHGTLFYMFAFISGGGFEMYLNRAAGAAATQLPKLK